MPALQPANRNVFNYLPQSIKMQVSIITSIAEGCGQFVGNVPMSALLTDTCFVAIAFFCAAKQCHVVVRGALFLCLVSRREIVQSNRSDETDFDDVFNDVFDDVVQRRTGFFRSFAPHAYRPSYRLP